MSTETADLPSREDLELTSYKLSSFLSDLDSMLLTARAASKDRATPEYDRADQLAHLLAWTTDALADAAVVERDAKELQALALGLYQEANAEVLDRGYWERVDGWHREALAATEKR
jgi:hypothetical protein